MNIARESVFTCPPCGIAKREVMPTDSCVFSPGCGWLFAIVTGLVSRCAVD